MTRPLSLDNRTLDAGADGRGGGNQQDPPTDCNGFVDDDHGETRHAGRNRLRQNLLAVIGSEKHLDLHLRFADGSLNYSSFAAELGRDRRTIKRWIAHDLAVIRKRWQRQLAEVAHAAMMTNSGRVFVSPWTIQPKRFLPLDASSLDEFERRYTGAATSDQIEAYLVLVQKVLFGLRNAHLSVLFCEETDLTHLGIVILCGRTADTAKGIAFRSTYRRAA